MVRSRGLEPLLIKNWILNPARLPIPPRPLIDLPAQSASAQPPLHILPDGAFLPVAVRRMLSSRSGMMRPAFRAAAPPGAFPADTGTAALLRQAFALFGLFTHTHALPPYHPATRGLSRQRPIPTVPAAYSSIPGVSPGGDPGKERARTLSFCIINYFPEFVKPRCPGGIPPGRPMTVARTRRKAIPPASA